MICRGLNPIVLAALVLLVPVLVIACADEDTLPAGLTRAEVEEIVRAEVGDAPGRRNPA